MKKQLLKSIRIRNFKAIQDSRLVRLKPLTVLIGNNGSGKSSFIDALQTLESIVQKDVDSAMDAHHGFEHAWNKAVSHATFAPKKNRPPPAGRNRPHCINPMSFELSGTMEGKRSGAYRADMEITAEPGQEPDRIFIQHESVQFGDRSRIDRDDRGRIKYEPWPEGEGRRIQTRLEDGESALKDLGVAGMGRWQFLTLIPQNMGEPTPQKRASGEVRLTKDGSNIAQYLRWIQDQDVAVYDGIVESMRFVLSYARDVQPSLTSQLERTVYLQMTEQGFKVPGWLFSTGTLRVLALLALLRSPQPPPFIVVEEVENGLDPRTIHLVLEEIRSAVQAGVSQVLLTTHSPYFLDLLPLETLVLCERDELGVPRFWRPSDSADVKSWATNFAPGQLYTAGRFKDGGKS
ncbi:MAG TPA: chromosome segregation protein SMC [Verrucomicrobia bacterium]|nr:MAG: hypothetical protein A2X46_03185 [Lentisphaerae bacterium GWF2_57_35]HBA84214.1 chromosome segregation protein SMC [Verrucomicrobiota bacterium]